MLPVSPLPSSRPPTTPPPAEYLPPPFPNTNILKSCQVRGPQPQWRLAQRAPNSQKLNRHTHIMLPLDPPPSSRPPIPPPPGTSPLPSPPPPFPNTYIHKSCQVRGPQPQWCGGQRAPNSQKLNRHTHIMLPLVPLPQGRVPPSPTPPPPIPQHSHL
jgi:hypothetical protein